MLIQALMCTTLFSPVGGSVAEQAQRSRPHNSHRASRRPCAIRGVETLDNRSWSDEMIPACCASRQVEESFENYL